MDPQTPGSETEVQPDGVEPESGERERQADRASGESLRVVPDDELSPEVINRIPLEDLEQRRLRAIGK